MIQTLKLSGAIVVTTPQQVALADARKAVDMFQNEKINIPVLGLVENMSWFTPAELPQNRYYLFGKDGGEELAKERGVAMLGQIPLVQAVCESGDAGKPVALNADTVMGQAFRQLASAVQQRLEDL
jgi:ATP-binding protein involved in chromosome partitioning